jgi:hypothetical protein
VAYLLPRRPQSNSTKKVRAQFSTIVNAKLGHSAEINVSAKNGNHVQHMRKQKHGNQSTATVPRPAHGKTPHRGHGNRRPLVITATANTAPVRFNGRLAWPVSEIKRVMGVTA